MRDDVYHVWFKFVRWAAPLSLFLILISPEYATDWMYPIEKGTVAFLASIAIVITSTGIIAWKYYALRRA